MPLAPHHLRITGTPSALPVIEVRGEETLGGLYAYRIVCEGSAADQPRILSRAELSLGGQRTVWGVITQVLAQRLRGVSRLELLLEPRLAALRHQRRNQVFLNQTSIETVQAVLTQCGLSAQWQDWQTTARYPAFAQRTCHEQDSLGFVLWLLEYEGIGLRFEQTPSGERMVFFDDPSGYDRSTAYLQGLVVAPPAGLATDTLPETLTAASVRAAAQPAAVRLTDYDPLQAHLDLGSQARAAPADTETDLTLQHHGEHYKTPEDGQRLAQVRLQARQCRARTLHAEGPLIALIAGTVIQLRDPSLAGYWLVTRMTLTTHRDGSLQVRFEACNASQPWRPERLTQRPKVHGLLSAKIADTHTSNYPIAQLDELGRYFVQYPWQDEAASKPIRMAQGYAGPGYGTHAPLKPETEIWLTHANGDPDRPIILGAVHRGGQGDAVTAKDSSRNVIRTLAGNKLRLEDEQGQEHIKLHTPQGNSQLNLGHAVDHTNRPRGQGVELRSEFFGAVRSGQQLQITTGQGSPRSGGEAANTHGSTEARATLANLQAFIGNRSTAASQVGANPHNSIASAGWVSDALQDTAQTPIGDSKPNQVHWAQAGQVSVAPTVTGSASKDLGAWSIGAQDWLAGGRLQIAARDATRLHIEQGGRKAFVSQGNHETTVTQGNFHLVVEGSVVLQSQSGNVSFKAGGASLMLTPGGHVGIKAAGSAVYQARVQTARAPAVMMQGGSAAQVPGELQSTIPKVQDVLALNYHYDDLTPVVGAPYKLTWAGGEVREGTLDAQGHAVIADPPRGEYVAEFGEDSRPWAPPPATAEPAAFEQSATQSQGRSAIEQMLATTPPTDTPGADAW